MGTGVCLHVLLLGRILIRSSCLAAPPPASLLCSLHLGWHGKAVAPIDCSDVHMIPTKADQRQGTTVYSLPCTLASPPRPKQELNLEQDSGPPVYLHLCFSYVAHRTTAACTYYPPISTYYLYIPIPPPPGCSHNPHGTPEVLFTMLHVYSLHSTGQGTPASLALMESPTVPMGIDESDLVQSRGGGGWPHFQPHPAAEVRRQCSVPRLSGCRRGP